MNNQITIGRCRDCMWRDADGNCTNNEKLNVAPERTNET